ncbi:MSMEG_1061 family FMN-dependent PPOX-type flavoprotein [Paenibacillus daejeonensis]|uniref:MSMEG_1061 family FMN-dependent PPOX-type flavoprotein n=1 Tax=Paenibacillus daejeonensis TaxID=135193 RepID=UPI000370AC9A|nr:MSMEG_1061 family FMN-dependent PPOX-type flavoprotein [Paenibacillus daejeonensis]
MIHILQWNGVIEDRITDPEQLRKLVGEPHEAVVKKSIAQIDSHVRDYLARSPLFFLSTTDRQGWCDVSPRGDEVGFVKVLDDRRLIYPERPGNRRVDSLLNLLDNPRLGMLSIIPGMQEVLRMNGRAHITSQEDLIAAQNFSGKTPQLAVIVEVEECFIHCPRALKTSGVWSYEDWLPKDEHPSVSEMFQAHLAINGMKLK